MRSFFSHISIIKYLLFFSIVFFSTSSYTQSYFPPISGNSWDTISPSNLNWCQENIDTLINFSSSVAPNAILAPNSAKASAQAFPNPLLPPLINATFPSRLNLFFKFISKII